MEARTVEMEICNRFGKHFGGRIALVFGSPLKIINAKRSGRDGAKAVVCTWLRIRIILGISPPPGLRPYLGLIKSRAVVLLPRHR